MLIRIQNVRSTVSQKRNSISFYIYQISFFIQIDFHCISIDHEYDKNISILMISINKQSTNELSPEFIIHINAVIQRTTYYTKDKWRTGKFLNFATSRTTSLSAGQTEKFCLLSRNPGSNRVFNRSCEKNSLSRIYSSTSRRKAAEQTSRVFWDLITTEEASGTWRHTTALWVERTAFRWEERDLALARVISNVREQKTRAGVDDTTSQRHWETNEPVRTGRQDTFTALLARLFHFFRTMETITLL